MQSEVRPGLSRHLQTALLVALLLVCLAPFLANTTSTEKARMTIKGVAVTAALACVYLNRARFVLRPSTPGMLAGGLLVLASGVLCVLDLKGVLREPGLGFILGPLGVAFAATGFRLSKLHAQCLGLFALAAVPAGLVENLIESLFGYSLIVAKISAFSLHYVGFEVAVKHDTIFIGDSTVRIIAECSGLKLFYMLFSFFFILLLMLLELRRIFWKMLFAALGTGFVISILRTDLLVLIVKNTKWFDFFHHGLGSELISMTAIVVFGFFIKEELITALEKKLPVKAMPQENLPLNASPLVITLGVYCLIGLASAAVVELLK